MATKVLVWGIGNEFWELYNLLLLNESVGKFIIVGYVDRERKQKYIDGKEVFTPDEIMESGVHFEYIIVATKTYYKEISDYGYKCLHIERKKFINGAVLKIPYFDWEKYLQIYNRNLSIISETCLGGSIMHSLGLPFCSPFVNVRIGIQKNDYFKMIDNLDDYMSQTPSENPACSYGDNNWNGWEGRICFPRLWYDDILIHGFHYSSQESFLKKWEERRKRYNSDNRFILKILYDQEDVEKFIRIECKKKLGFYHQKVNHDNIVSIYSDEISGRYAYQYTGYLFDLAQSGKIFAYADFFTLFGCE